MDGLYNFKNYLYSKINVNKPHGRKESNWSSPKNVETTRQIFRQLGKEENGDNKTNH